MNTASLWPRRREQVDEMQRSCAITRYNRSVDEPRPVLCVEDNDANFALIRRVLETTGRWQVTRATNVAQARAALDDIEPVVLVLDIDLPEISGLELAREMKTSTRWQQIPIVVVSASVMRQEQVKAREAGCEYFLEKPFDIDVLRSTVAAAYELFMPPRSTSH